MTLQPDMQNVTADHDVALALNDADFARIAKLVHEIAGIVLPENKRPLVQSRLQKRLRALGLTGFGGYADFIARKDNEAERRELISAVTTNVTSFFREVHHFDLLTQKVLPDLVARAKAGGRVRFWSAGCSTGEEPYSIAATVAAALPDAQRYDLRILATDIDRMVLQRVDAASYSRDALSGLPPDKSRLLFGDSLGSGDLRISESLRRLVACKPLNLQAEWPMRGPFDVIFCRNVVIYFDKLTQERLWLRFKDLLARGGYLIIGHSERLSGAALADFVTEGITAYRRI
jgi:chemotaxis protein methyltransferase CheR